jgi:putative methylase
MVRKRRIEILLSQVEPHPSPKAYLEQYTIPAGVAAEILYLATYTYDDIVDKRVVDLGCGTGRLAIGAVLMGAKEAVGIDIDETAVKIARQNSEKLGVKGRTYWVVGDIGFLCGKFDTVLQNPPFGVQRRKADRKFLLKALELGHYIYSLHKAGNEEFIKRFIEKHGGKVTGIIPFEIWIPHTFPFHIKRKYLVKVKLYRIEGRNNVSRSRN